MSKKYYFFSDVHLGFGSREVEKIKEKRLLKFLDKISIDAEKIYIVGDLFDCWIEYRKAVPKGYYRTLSKLNEITESGTEINFISGNHDFWTNTYLRDDVGLILHDKMETIIEGRKFYIIHGDGLSGNDIGYRLLKMVLRNRVNQFLYSCIHPDIGLTIAQSSSRKSRFHSADNSRGSKGMLDFAKNKIHEGFDFVVMGHYHKPQSTEININGRSGYYITLGDWIENYTYGEFSSGEFRIRKYTD